MVIEDNNKVFNILYAINKIADNKDITSVMLENLYTIRLSDEGGFPREVMSFDVKYAELSVSIDYCVEGDTYSADYVNLKINTMKKMWYESDSVDTLKLATDVLNKLKAYLSWRADREYNISKIALRVKLNEYGIE